MFFKNMLRVGATIFVVIFFVFILMSVTSVPEVYAVSDTLGDGTDPSSWEIRQISENGEGIPYKQWDQVLQGRFRVIPVSPDWYPSISEEES
jgi:hypothetical protein